MKKSISYARLVLIAGAVFSLPVAAVMAVETNAPIAETTQLAAMTITLAQAEAILARLEAYQQSALKNTGKGSYHILIDNKRTTHMHFSDLPLLQASDIEEAQTAVQVLAIVRSYTLAFFDKMLRGTRSPLLEGSVPITFVDGVHHFKPGKRPTKQ